MATQLATVPKTRSIDVLRDKYLSLKNRIGTLNEKAGEKIEGVVKTLEIQGAAFIMGAVQGAWFDPTKEGKPGMHWFGAPVEAVVGVGFILAGLFGVGGDRWSTHVLNVGNGSLAAWSANMGRGFGYKWRKERESGKGGRAKTSGADLREEIASLLDE